MCRQTPDNLMDTKILQAANPLGAGAARGRGFSMLELVIVLAIMTTLAAIAAPRYQESIIRYRADLAARRVAADLELAQATAKAKGSAQTVIINESTDTVVLSGRPGLDPHVTEYWTELSESPYRADVTESSFLDDNSIIFDGWGIPDSGGHAIVQVGSETRTINVDADTGKATIQ
ncbi:MAG: prepilin-type N-terminal cleavage/methylation domain-containing protein [Planctomycetota bacterium]